MGEMMEPRSAYYESQRLRMHYVVWGEGTSDEMCLGILVMAPSA